MMVYGIGNDICDIRRIRAGFERHGERFAQRILGPAELAAWHSRRARWPERGVRYLATRFSAKEAFSKAIGLGLRLPLRWQWCEIANHPGGAPCVVLHGDLKHWFDARGLQAHISLSDESDYAASFCVVMCGSALPASASAAAAAPA
jgi:holo-[acyl-carrier-protein] synthase